MSSLSYQHSDHTLPHFPVSQAEPPGLFGHVAYREALVFEIHMSLVTVPWPHHVLSVQSKSHFLALFLQAFALLSFWSPGGEISSSVSIMLPSLGEMEAALLCTFRMTTLAGE